MINIQNAQETPNWFWQWEQAVPKEFCEFLLKSLDWSEHKPGTVYGDGNSANFEPGQRRTDVVWAPSSSPVGCILQTHITMANVHANWNFHIMSMEDVQFGRYDEGDEGFYDWHRDCGIVESGIQRKLSASLLLSDPSTFEGGKLEFEGYEGVPILPNQGSLIVFPSFIKHRVTPVTSGQRISAVSWMLGQSFR